MTKQYKPLKSLIASAVGIAAATLSVGAHATLLDGIVDSWTVGVNSIFNTATMCDSNGDCTQPNGIDVISTQSLRWGDSTASGRSGLDIGNSGNTIVNTNGAAVPNVTITHLNNPITGTTLRSLDIVSALSLTPLLPPSPGLPTVYQVFGVKFLETPNAANPCANGGANGVGINNAGCADIFVTDAQALNFEFYYDLDGDGAFYNPVKYFISFYEATSGLNPLPTAACLAATGSSDVCRGFMTAENQDTTVQFATVITTEPVGIPEPATLALLGLGLLGAGVARRRRS